MTEIEQKFKVGDIVTLKTGSPKMTITEIELHSKTNSFKGVVICQWFNDEFKELKINQDALDLVTQ